MNISAENYWDSTLQVCKSALGLLSAFENDNNTLINNAIEPLRQLIDQASDLESLKTFHGKIAPKDPKGKGKQVLEPRENAIQFHLDPSWTVVDDRTVNITIESTGTVIVAKTVTTPEELDSLIARMYEVGRASLDCEFIAFKEGPPQLQILQVAVSTTEGYAIIIDKVGVDALTAKLKPCLEDQTMNFVGWAFRSDASAIERTLKGILLAPILDLQAKLRPVAVEEMSLYAGVSKYAPDWEALKEFQDAKLNGDSFEYFEGDCIWLKDPLPPVALVYAVFDVVSLEALVKSTEIYPTLDDHYWPLTITKNAGSKAMSNYHKQRAIDFSTAIVDTKELKNQNGYHFSNKRGYSKSRKSFNNSSQKEYDPEAQYKDDMQKALYLSLQETRHSSTPGHASSSKAEDRVIDFDASELQYSNLGLESDLPLTNGVPSFDDKPAEEEEEEPVLEITWSDIVNEKQKPFLGLGWLANQGNSDDSKSNGSHVSTSPVETNESKVIDLRRPMEPTSPHTQGVEQTPSSATSDKTASSQVRQLFDAKPKRLSQDSNNNNNNNVNSLFSSKPDKSSYAKYMKTSGGVTNQTGTFGWDDDTYNGGGGKAWKDFAQTAKTGWSNNVDTDPNNIDEIKPSTQTTTTPPKPHEQVKFNTSSTNTWYSKEILSPDHNEWNVETERPTVMTMPITKFEARKSKGPRCINPMDSDFGEDDSDEASDDDEDEEDDDDEDGGVGNSGTKNDGESGSDEKNSTDQSSTANYYTHNEGQWTQWSNQNYSGNQYSRRSSYERNNSNNSNNSSSSNSRSTRGSWIYSGDQRPNNNYNSNNNNYGYNNYNNRYSHNNNNNYNNKWSNRNSGSSSSSSSSSTPQPTQTKQVITTNTTERYDKLDIYDKELYTNTGDYIKIFKLTVPSHLDQIILPPLDSQFTVAITYHLIPIQNEKRFQLKALQLYLPDNSSFNVIIGQACHENSTETTLNSKLNTLLTHPNINRIAWFPGFFDLLLKEKTGVEIGRVVDIGRKMHEVSDEDCGPDFISAINHYLKDWPSLEQFKTAKMEYDGFSKKKKFISTWDRDRIPDSTLEYSSLQGAALFKLYHHNKISSVPDDNFIFKRE